MFVSTNYYTTLTDGDGRLTLTLDFSLQTVNVLQDFLGGR